VHTQGHRDEQASERRTPSSQPRATDSLLTLQAQAGNAAVAHLLAPPVTIQRITRRRAGNRMYAVTVGELFAIREAGSADDLATVWVRDGTASPPFLQPSATPDVTIGGHVYHAHSPRYALLEDCLHAAEEIINGLGRLPATGDYSIVAATGSAFGAGADENVAAALGAVAAGAAVDAAANPGVGQAFVIVNMNPLAPPYPYHAAAVVAADGPDRITLEQTRVVPQNQRPPRTAGRTRIYTVNTAQSFHSAWSRSFPNARTIVIERRPPRRSARAREAPNRYHPYSRS